MLNRKHISTPIKVLLLVLFMAFLGGYAHAQNVAAPDSTIKTTISSPTLTNSTDSTLNLELNKTSAVFTDSAATIASISYPDFSDSVYSTRIMAIQNRVPLAYNEQVKRFIDMYVVYKRDLVSRILGCSSLYYPIFDTVFARYNIPPEIKNLAVVESALNPQAVSRCGATGMWQFMYYTARLYNLKINSYLDERKDIIKATQAAAQYLTESYAEFGDWLLAIASYNCGKVNVERAIARSHSTSFWDVSHYLPYETRSYIPLFIAATYVMNYYSEHQITPTPLDYDLCSIQCVNVDQKISLAQIAKVTETPIDELKYLNPSIRFNVLPSTDDGYTLKLPEDKMGIFMAYKDSIYSLSRNEAVQSYSSYAYGPRKNYVGNTDGTYIVQSGDNLYGIARSFGTNIAQLKEWNNLNGNYIYRGMHLKVANNTIASAVKLKTKAKPIIATTTVASASTATETPKPQGKAVFYTVRPGDSLWLIAKRYPGVTIDSIKQVNEYAKWAYLKPGTVLKIVI